MPERDYSKPVSEEQEALLDALNCSHAFKLATGGDVPVHVEDLARSRRLLAEHDRRTEEKGRIAGLIEARDKLAGAAAHVQSLEEHGLSTHSASANLAYEMHLLTEEIERLRPAPAKEEKHGS